MNIPYRDKIYLLSENASGPLNWPKAALLILRLEADVQKLRLSAELEALTASKIGKFIDAHGGLSQKGLRVFAEDREVLAAAEKHRLHAKLDETKSPSADQRKGDGDIPSHEPAPPSPEPAEGLVGCADPKPTGLVAVDTASSSPASLSTLLAEVQTFLIRFMVFSDPAQVVACTLWVAHTWVLDAFKFTPYLFIHSPVKRCGKTRLLDCLKVLVHRPWSIVAGTEATIMRKIDAERPTLLFDEIDTVYRSGRDRSRESLRAVLNVGFSRGATIPRCSGSGVVEYSVFGAKVFAGIGESLPATVKDRSIPIRLARRSKDQQVESMRHPDFGGTSDRLSEMMQLWAENSDVVESLAESRPDVPHELGDRAADIASPLLAIADLAGGMWPTACRAALVNLLREDEDDNGGDPEIRLLAAIRDVFSAEGKAQLSTLQILRGLAAREEEEDWTTRWPRQTAAGNTRGPAARMATLLRPYKISARTIRLPDGSTPKGYHLSDFSDAFARYLPPAPKEVATSPHAAPSTEASAPPCGDVAS